MTKLPETVIIINFIYLFHVAQQICHQILTILKVNSIGHST